MWLTDALHPVIFKHQTELGTRGCACFLVIVKNKEFEMCARGLSKRWQWETVMHAVFLQQVYSVELMEGSCLCLCRLSSPASQWALCWLLPRNLTKKDGGKKILLYCIIVKQSILWHNMDGFRACDCEWLVIFRNSVIQDQGLRKGFIYPI